MKLLLLGVAFLHWLSCVAQSTVTNPKPLVTVNFAKYVYVNFDNPMCITTGNRHSLTVTTDNGTIKPTAKKGEYVLRPSRVGAFSVTLSANKYKQTFNFEARAMQYPEIGLVPGEFGISPGHGIVLLEYSKGISPQQRFFDIDLGFKVDSFTLEIADSLGNKASHQNIGWQWDSTSKKLIKEAKPKSEALIHSVWMSREGQRFKSYAYLRCWLWWQ